MHRIAKKSDEMWPGGEEAADGKEQKSRRRRRLWKKVSQFHFF